jgi:hypothetical protein
MRIYLDSKDIIKLLEKSDPCTTAEFDNFLRNGNHELVLSFVTIMEISEPLFHKKAKTNVMWLLIEIEKLPHIFIHSSMITRLELEEAYRAFAIGDNYHDVFPPFIGRFDIIVDLHGNPATMQYINYHLAETVWDLYNFGGLGGFNKYAGKLRETFKADRALNPKPSLKKNFANMIVKNIKLYQLKIPLEDVTSFANWIYSNPKRCPSDRLGYELWHKMVKNITDIPDDSDLEDFQNIAALPYVDVMTLDRRMHGYICQVSKDLSVDYHKKIFRNTKEIINNIGRI